MSVQQKVVFIQRGLPGLGIHEDPPIIRSIVHDDQRLGFFFPSTQGILPAAGSDDLPDHGLTVPRLPRWHVGYVGAVQWRLLSLPCPSDSHIRMVCEGNCF